MMMGGMVGKRKAVVLTLLLALALGLVCTCALAAWVVVTAERTTAALPEVVAEKLAKYHGQYVPLDEISPYVAEAAIASQDRRFETNSGVDLRANIRAVFYTIKEEQRQGASTITEQLAKNAYYHDVDSPDTDVKTKVLALFITRQFSKNKILEMYLNIIYYGRGTYGIGTASQTFFKVKPEDLSLWQSAYLIGLINAPGYFDREPLRAVEEAKVILGEMKGTGRISAGQYESAVNVAANGGVTTVLH